MGPLVQLRQIKNLPTDGFAFLDSGLEPKFLSTLRGSIFAMDGPGARCLLDDPLVRSAAKLAADRLRSEQLLSHNAVAIQALAFDKTASMNWKITWHQDLMFPFARPVSEKGYASPCVKSGVKFARPPVSVLKDLLAVRIHLDKCDEGNGPLKVVPGSHRKGVITSAEIASTVASQPSVSCIAGEGEVLLMKPLLVHSSSRAERPGHRRVLHLVYHDGPPLAEAWHRAL